jgi:hypothetical protein
MTCMIAFLLVLQKLTNTSFIGKSVSTNMANVGTTYNLTSRDDCTSLKLETPRRGKANVHRYPMRESSCLTFSVQTITDALQTFLRSVAKFKVTVTFFRVKRS